MKKYKLTRQTTTVIVNGGLITLYRIQACRKINIPNGQINKGDLGGWV